MIYEAVIFVTFVSVIVVIKMIKVDSKKENDPLKSFIKKLKI